MIGRADPAVAPDALWLTGFDRSNLGPTLAQHGAHLVADPHPAQNFFQRSDNYALARQGIIAQTVSSFGLHKDYHQPSDELAAIDFPHMVNAIASIVEPIRWLANTTWRPAWSAPDSVCDHRKHHAKLGISHEVTARSKRSRFITLLQVATKSCTNFCCESLLA